MKTIRKIRKKRAKKQRNTWMHGLTPGQIKRGRRNFAMAYDVLEGLSFEDAAEKYGFNSKQSAQKQFRLTVVNFFGKSYLNEFKRKSYDIWYLRELWNKL